MRARARAGPGYGIPQTHPKAVKDNIMDAANSNVREALVKNPKYTEISDLTERLGAARKLMVRVNGAGKEFFAPTIMSDAKSTRVLGIETVCTTYVLFKLQAAVEPIKSPIGRRRLVQELRSQVEAKGGSFGESIDKYVEGLLSAPLAPEDKQEQPKVEDTT